MFNLHFKIDDAFVEIQIQHIAMWKIKHYTSMRINEVLIKFDYQPLCKF